MPRLKVCGINDAAFAVEAARRGIDYLGLIFAEGSPRRVTVEQAQEIIAAVNRVELGSNRVGLASGRAGSPLPAAPLASGRAGNPLPAAPRFVGVFVKHASSDIADIAARVGLDVIQLHGDYGADEIAFLKAKGYEVWRLYNPSRPPADGCEDAVLLDGRRGTKSHRADWSHVEPLKRAGRRVVLAGSISADNIADAVATGADVIDVNSSIEVAPGVKSVGLLDELLKRKNRQ